MAAAMTVAIPIVKGSEVWFWSRRRRDVGKSTRIWAKVTFVSADRRTARVRLHHPRCVHIQTIDMERLEAVQ